MYMINKRQSNIYCKNNINNISIRYQRVRLYGLFDA